MTTLQPFHRDFEETYFVIQLNPLTLSLSSVHLLVSGGRSQCQSSHSCSTGQCACELQTESQRIPFSSDQEQPPPPPKNPNQTFCSKGISYNKWLEVVYQKIRESWTWWLIFFSPSSLERQSQEDLRVLGQPDL